jgi:hypothetical protein
MHGGSRKVVTVTEVLGMESDVITLQDLYRFELDEHSSLRNVEGRLAATGLRPSFLHKFERRGIAVPAAYATPALRPAVQGIGRAH